MTSRLVRPATLAAVVRVAIVTVAAAALSVAIAVAAPAAAFALPSGCSQVGGTVACQVAGDAGAPSSRFRQESLR